MRIAISMLLILAAANIVSVASAEEKALKAKNVFEFKEDFTLFDMKALRDPSTLDSLVRFDWRNVEGNVPTRMKQVNVYVHSVLGNEKIRTEVQFIVPRDRKAKGFLMSNDGKFIDGDKKQDFSELEATLLRNGVGLVKVCLHQEDLRRRKKFRGGWKELKYGSLYPSTMNDYYIEHLDPTHAVEYGFWPSLLIRGTTAAFAETEHFEKGKVAHTGVSKHGASSNIATIYDDRVTGLFPHVAPVSHSPVRLHDKKIWHERRKGANPHSFEGGIYGGNYTQGFQDAGHKWEDIEKYAKNIAPHLFLSLNEDKLQKRGVEILCSTGTHDCVAYDVYAIGKNAPWVPIALCANGGHRGPPNAKDFAPNYYPGILRHFLGADKPRMLPPAVKHKRNGDKLKVTLTFAEGIEPDAGEIWWLYDRAPDGTQEYYEASFDVKRRLDLKKVSPQVWEGEITLESGKRAIDFFASFHRMAKIAGKERKETISCPYTRVELK